MDASNDMYKALLLSHLRDMTDDSLILVEDQETEPEVHMPKGFALKALNVDNGKLEEYLQLLKSSEGHYWSESCAEEFYRLMTGRVASEGVKEIPGTETMHFIDWEDQ